MFEKLKEETPLFYSQLSAALKNKKISHAYLIDVGNNDEYLSILKQFVISVLSLAEDMQSIDYEKLIMNDNYPDFVVISPNNSRWIKKEQIIELQSKYKTKSSYNNKKVYVIDKADDLNQSSGNTLLKFLEEPNDDTLAILITRNSYNVMPTIVSRCQLIKMDQKDILENAIVKEKVIEFLNIVYKYKRSSFPFIKNIDYNFDDKDNILVFVNEIIKFYYDLVRFILKKELLYYNDYEGQIGQMFNESLNIDDISFLILKLDDLYNLLQYNINSRLFMDQLIMTIVGVDFNV